MKTSIIRSWNELPELWNEWNGLLKKSDAHQLFLSWEWLESWVSAIQQKVLPYIITVRDQDDRLIGIAPFYISTTRLFGIVDFTTLRITADYPTGFEYADFIVDPANEEQILDAIGQTLYTNRSQWDLIWLPKITGWTNSLRRVVHAVSTQSGLLFNRRDTVFSTIKLPDSIAKYDATFTSKRRNHLRRLKKKVFADINPAFINCERIDQLEYFLDALFKLHHKRHMLLDDPGTFVRAPSQEVFYRHFTHKALKNGSLRITALQARGEIQAIQLGYVCDKSYLQIQEGFNPDFVTGAGNVLRHHVIAQCISEGLVEYDFLGGFNEHKRRWGAKVRIGHDILIGNSNIKSRLLIKMKIWPTGRYLRPSGLVD